MKEIIFKGGKAFVNESGKVFVICDDCGELVCVNKSFFGSMHFCAGG